MEIVISCDFILVVIVSISVDVFDVFQIPFGFGADLPFFVIRGV